MRDVIFPYRVRANRLEAHCRLRLFPLEHKTVAIASELADNLGMSITNASEEVATQVVEHYGIDPERLLWVEHYPHPGQGTFDLVEFLWNGEEFRSPSWSPSSKLEVEQMIGASL